MTYFEKRAEESTDHVKRQLFSLAAMAEQKGFKAKVTPRAVHIGLDGRRVSKSEVEAALPETGSFLGRAPHGNVKVSL